jgi:predicted ATP-binding protein involved in virulence
VRLEPVFRDPEERRVEFDDLPRSLRHVVAFGALVVRALAAACLDRDPRESEGVVLLDDLESEQPLFRQRTLVNRLHRALPRVQWIITTSSPDVALGCPPSSLIALRRRPGGAAIDLHEGVDAVLH